MQIFQRILLQELENGGGFLSRWRVPGDGGGVRKVAYIKRDHDDDQRHLALGASGKKVFVFQFGVSTPLARLTTSCASMRDDGGGSGVDGGGCVSALACFGGS